MKKFKKVISILLAVLMTFSAVGVVAFAEEDATVDYTNQLITAATGSDEKVATIILPGIGQSDSTYVKEDGSTVSGGLVLLDTDAIAGPVITKLAWPLLKSIGTQTADPGLQDAVHDVISDLFYIQASNKDGTAKEDLILTRYPYALSQYDEDDHGWFYRMFPMEPVVEAMDAKYGAADPSYNAEDYIYLSTFQLIANPHDSARELKDFIAMVKEQTGCEKVNLVPISLGGTIMTSYLQLVQEEYNGDFSDINKIINIVACLNGTDLFSDFFAREWNLADEFLYDEYIDLIVEANGMEPYMGGLIKILLKIIPKPALYAILSGAIEGLLDTMFVNCPQFWAMVTKERYEGLADRYLVGEEYAALRKETDWFQNARMNLIDNLNYVKDNYGVVTYSVAAYGLQFTDGEYNFFGIAGSSATTNSDGIINISSASLGASYVVPGAKYENAVMPSPDGELDISTCAFPETTWFFDNQHHEVGRNDVILKLLGQILVGNITDVDSSAAFPQFNYGRVTRNLTREGWLMDQAESVIANEEGLYTQDQIDTVKPVYEKAAAMLNETLLNENSADEAAAITKELNDALACTGLTSKEAEPDFFTQLLNKILAPEA
ncbi:MAG: hypothetical protein J6Q94_06770 [Clostridia bacterium]|nr:hypothetical protein [Clostridia bacterium]